MVPYDKFASYEINLQYNEPDNEFNHHWIEPVSELATRVRNQMTTGPWSYEIKNKQNWVKWKDTFAYDPHL